MSTFSNKDFDSNNYQTRRPGYPDSLFKAIDQYHQGEHHKALDVGCGPGTATFQLTEYYDQVIGCDPSTVMIQPGIDSITDNVRGGISFEVSPAEDLSAVAPEDESFDLITSAEALHWFNHGKFFKEAARVLKPNGTLAFWGYMEPRFIDFPEADVIYEQYVFSDPQFMGPLWKPGKHYLRNFYDQVEIPSELFKDVERYHYYPKKSQAKTAYFLGDEKYNMVKLADYLSSWSAVHDWNQEHPESVGVDKQLVSKLKETFGWSDSTELRVEWGTVYVFARRI
ncbi:hypothetical protein WICPIJ_008365 [Wickerhamomyces pijperi]|uniref:Methyltransferase type 11 domain-containing protein n=1 Tax=Wickerhamomyces pijperi TaxID=599730 RepID=A0A9P8PXT4_WICPI|nr:hypothetical protein WICPIJ_008365 [Wickerhamomyces pijperi]